MTKPSPTRRFHVTVIEWLTHKEDIEAADETAARREPSAFGG